ncbi:hypothetical protein LLG90_08240 [Aromatoleum toluclasticum]|uniref:hypothetical protein n=1 Tax=Aromatoleum toluclasticum TaxID=92003 RepID=UPI001D18D58F|nr:hypothetical protein [Aromatoleum toluclasticum]MCC4115333.1 hypothetical protein [Aromatoleum toluclasticum]
MSTKLGQRVMRLEGKANAAEPLDIIVKFIQPGTMRVTGEMAYRKGEFVRVTTTPEAPKQANDRQE